MLASIATMMQHPLDFIDELKGSRREFHNAIGGFNPEFHPKRTKFKGYMRNKSTFNKNR